MKEQFALTPHNYKNYLKLLSDISEDKEVKQTINEFLLKVTKDKQFKKEFKSYLFDEPIPQVAPLPENILDFVENFEYYSMN